MDFFPALSTYRDLAEQAVRFRKSSFENAFAAAEMAQERIDQMVASAWHQVPGLPEEGRRFIENWMMSLREGRRTCRRAVRDYYSHLQLWVNPLEEIRTTSADADGRGSEEEDAGILLKVPHLDVDGIRLDVEIKSESSSGKVELEVRGVEARALLHVDLDQLHPVLARILDTVDRNLAKTIEKKTGEGEGGSGGGDRQETG